MNWDGLSYLGGAIGGYAPKETLLPSDSIASLAVSSIAWP